MVSKRKRETPTIRKPSPKPARKKRLYSAQYKMISSCTDNKIKKQLSPRINYLSTTYKNASFSRIDELRNISNYEKYAILIGVVGYLPGSPSIHANHAIAAFKWGDTLYCFDPWGEKMKRKAEDVFYFINVYAQCKSVIMYRGPNLQDLDETGVCVGLSANFLMYMSRRVYKFRTPFDQAVYQFLIQIPIENIEAELARKIHVRSVKEMKSR